MTHDDQHDNRRKNGTDRWIMRLMVLGAFFAVMTFAAIMLVAGRTFGWW